MKKSTLNEKTSIVDYKGRVESCKFHPLYSLGIDIGYSSVKIALIDEKDDVVYTDYVMHKGKIKESLKSALATLSKKHNIENIMTGAVIGSGSRFVKTNKKLDQVDDVSALIKGSIKLNKNVHSIIEIGGETSRYITGFGKDDKSAIEISMNSNCSAGTGSFLEEQVSRLNLEIENFAPYAAISKYIPRIAGRCSVFAKTDIIHHQQEGVPVENILQGIAYALVRNYRASVIKRLPIENPIIFTGGVAQNGAIVNAIKDVLNLDDHELFVSDKCGTAAAIGASIVAKEEGLKLDLAEMRESLEL